MANPTYRDLLAKLQTATDEQLGANLTVFLAHQDEYLPITSIETADEESNDVLDAGHLYFRSE